MKFVYLSEVAHKSFCVKFGGLISNLKILEKSYFKSTNIQCTDLFGLFFFKLKKIMVRQ